MIGERGSEMTEPWHQSTKLASVDATIYLWHGGLPIYKSPWYTGLEPPRVAELRFTALGLKTPTLFTPDLVTLVEGKVPVLTDSGMRHLCRVIKESLKKSAEVERVGQITPDMLDLTVPSRKVRNGK